jgi:hypothetical protein
VFGFHTLFDLTVDAENLRRARYGVIEVQDGRLVKIRVRPLPASVSLAQIALVGRLEHRVRSGDRCRLYYNQPWGYDNFLVLKYIVSTRQGTLASLQRALETLEEIARLKNSDALLCDMANGRISAALAARGGWSPHAPSRWHRHFIKRFYGSYPPRPAWLTGLLSSNG